MKDGKKEKQMTKTNFFKKLKKKIFLNSKI